MHIGNSENGLMARLRRFAGLGTVCESVPTPAERITTVSTPQRTIATVSAGQMLWRESVDEERAKQYGDLK